MLKSQSLVVAVWDQDTTSRDDYMAGVSHLNNFILMTKNISVPCPASS